ncbi:MAG: sensor histidine kinase KdpD [Clostridiales bacterium]|jgi:two-component system sensor histidine kinase KdpD|nr:sensor histidine kinase KdpD [Clostridiales bacterium]
MEERRLNPDELLDKLTESESARGKLKIFFGYAAGVGKTYAMLDEAQELFKNKVNVLAGYIEPHTRPETLNLLIGLPALPPKIVQYKNIELKEFDIDSALEMKPDLVLVDELAHTNAKGSRNKKRYQDVEELLSAGIDVYTTVNVQHIESLNNIVSDITKVNVIETVPDYIFDHADHVEIIDIEPDELVRRFEEGKVYRPDRASVAVNNFFVKENLRLLREIAIRKAADRISHENQSAKQADKKTNYKLMVCVNNSPSAAKCVRWAARMAEAFFIPWVAVYVENTNSDDLSQAENKIRHDNIALAERLGAEIVTLSGVDVAETIAEYARLSGITNIVIGKSRRKKWFRPYLEDQLIELVPHIEVHIIPNSSDDKVSSNKKYPLRIKFDFSWVDTFKMAALMLLATGVSFLLQASNIGSQNIILVYIMAILAVSRVTVGHIYGVVSSVISVLIFTFFFTYPYFSFNTLAPDYPFTFLTMLLAALITSTLTIRVKKQAKLAVKREQRTEKLYEINRKLLATRGKENIIKIVSENIVQIFRRSVIFYTEPEKQSTGTLFENQGEHAEFLLREDEKAVAAWSYLNQKQAGAGTDTLMGAGAFYMPVVSQGKSLGVVGLSCERGKISTNSKFFLQLIVSQIAMALERQSLSDSQRQAIIVTEKEKMRSNLLRAISHDLRTPLTGILGASSTVLENFDSMTKEEMIKLIQNIKDDSGWLIRMVENLLSVTRINDDGANLTKSPEAVEEVVSESVSRIRQRFPESNILVRVPEELLIVPMDGILIEQVLTNLIENAIKHNNNKNSEVLVQVKKMNRHVIFEIKDQGSGILPADLPHLFDGLAEKSVSPDSSRGLGIGLSICKSIIDAHGGKIFAVNNKGGKGATFSFTIPM